MPHGFTIPGDGWFICSGGVVSVIQNTSSPKAVPELAANPFTLEIIQNALQAICDEMFTTLRRTSMSSVIYENLDFGVAVTDAQGRLACQGSGLPGFIGMLDSGVKHVIAKFGAAGQIRPGDIFATNDPYAGGVSHLNDVVLVLPVFDGAEIVAWMANKAHWSDVGGATVGSLTSDSTEIYHEGLQLPEVKLFAEGDANQAIVDIIAANSRTPDQVLGDMWAGVAAARAGETRLRALIARYSGRTVCFAIERFLEDGRRAALRALKELPKGTFRAEETNDNGQPLYVAITVTEDRFIVDLRGNPPRSATPYNCPYMCTQSAAQLIFKAVTDPHGITNEGTFRCLSVLCDDNSIFNAKRPTPVSLYYDPMLWVTDLIWKAVASGNPERWPAGQMNAVAGVTIAGVHPEAKNFCVMIDNQGGGWGGAVGTDGESAQMCVASGESYNCSVEVNEARNGVFIRSYSLNSADGGEGMYRGGRGVVVEYEIRSEEATVSASHNRSKQGPWGLCGGRRGSVNEIHVVRTDGREERYGTVTALPVAKGDVIIVMTAQGGGYGDPLKRPKDLLQSDLRDGYVSLEQASRYYGLESRK